MSFAKGLRRGIGSCRGRIAAGIIIGLGAVLAANGYLKKGENGMNASVGAAIIRDMAESLRSNPGQLHINVSVIGQSVVSHGGTGLSVQVNGGGAGSTTIGQRISADGGQVTIQRANQAMSTELSALVDSLNKIATELEKQNPDKSMLRNVMNSLLGTWVPGIVTSVLGNILTRTIGL